MYLSINQYLQVPVKLKEGFNVGGPHVIREGKHKALIL